MKKLILLITLLAITTTAFAASHNFSLLAPLEKGDSFTFVNERGRSIELSGSMYKFPGENFDAVFSIYSSGDDIYQIMTNSGDFLVVCSDISSLQTYFYLSRGDIVLIIDKDVTIDPSLINSRVKNVFISSESENYEEYARELRGAGLTVTPYTSTDTIVHENGSIYIKDGNNDVRPAGDENVIISNLSMNGLSLMATCPDCGHSFTVTTLNSFTYR